VNSATKTSSNKSIIVLNRKCARIYLVAEAASRSISLQVEVFPLLNSSQNTTTPDNLHTILESYILNLQYLLILYKSGFKLSFIEKEGIWFVKKVLDEEPSKEFCELILPPEDSSK
jgi:hypothetical protein